MSEGWTTKLPKEVTCSCGTRGPHESGPLCPQEGASLYGNEDFDPTLLRIRYDADPVVMALIGHAEHLLWTVRASRVVLIGQNQYMDGQRAEIAKKAEGFAKIENDWARQVDTLQREKAALQEQVRIAKQERESAKRLSANAKARIEGVMRKEGEWRAIIEELAIKTGYFEEDRGAYGWKPEQLLREATLERMAIKRPSDDEVLPDG